MYVSQLQMIFRKKVTLVKFVIVNHTYGCLSKAISRGCGSKAQFFVTCVNQYGIE